MSKEATCAEESSDGNSVQPDEVDLTCTTSAPDSAPSCSSTPAPCSDKDKGEQQPLDLNLSQATTADNHPWPGLKDFFEYVGVVRKKSNARARGGTRAQRTASHSHSFKCILCADSGAPEKEIKASVSTSSNLKRHLQLYHDDQHELWESGVTRLPREKRVWEHSEEEEEERGGGADDAHSDRPAAAATATPTTAAARGRSGSSLSSSSNVTSYSASGGHGPANKKKKTSQRQSTFLDFLPSGKFGSRSGGIIARTKKEVWQAVTVLVADNMFPFHCVERPSFKWFIDYMQTGRKPPSRTSLMRQLGSLYDLNKVRLLDVLTGIQYVATTCDLWSARHK